MIRHTKIFFILQIITLLLVLSCMPSPRTRGVESNKENINSRAGKNDNGSNAIGGDDSFGNSLNDLFSSGKSELRHFVDPFDGSYKTKITIPKNFTGFMYISGLNMTALASQHLKVRFNFGRELQAVVIDGVIVGRGEGITPTTDIDVLILDMSNKPFEHIRLFYDLYDYNSYSSGEAPTDDPRNSKLYCRGLRRQYDPTFKETSCSSSTSKCLYSYAKILDAGVYDTALTYYLSVTEPQLDTAGGGYKNMGTSEFLKRCLPDSDNKSNLAEVLGKSSSGTIGFGDDLSSISTDYSSYEYRGPYRPTAISEWEIVGDAIYGDYGIFKDRLLGPLILSSSCSTADTDGKCAVGGFQSRLFPTSGKIELKANIEHFSSTSVDSTAGSGREINTLISAGESDYVDGCNIRMRNYDSVAGEGISSCNVVASIEVFTKNSDGSESILVTSDDIKLQLIRPSQTDNQGREVLYTALKTCSSSNACGSDECCYNSRCWSKDLVSQCLEDSSALGNKLVGDSCNSDYQCSSLCCNQSLGTCQSHVYTSDEQVLCSKAPGQQCVTGQWCKQENVTTCKIYRTGISPTGQTTCEKRCYPVPTFGDCINGYCVTPKVPDVPTFDPNNCPANAEELPRN